MHRDILLCKGEANSPCFFLLYPVKLNDVLTALSPWGVQEEEKRTGLLLFQNVWQFQSSSLHRCAIFFSFFMYDLRKLCFAQNLNWWAPEKEKYNSSYNSCVRFPSVFTAKPQWIISSITVYCGTQEVDELRVPGCGYPIQYLKACQSFPGLFIHNRFRRVFSKPCHQGTLIVFLPPALCV